MKYSVLAVAILPVAGLAMFYFLTPRGSEPSPSTAKAPHASLPRVPRQEDPKRGSSSAVTDEHAEFLRAKKQREDEITAKRLELGQRWAARGPESFGNNGPFLQKKYGELFDSWGLNDSEREEFVQVLSAESVAMARAFTEYNTAYPFKVGHASNQTADNALTRELLASIEIVKKDTLARLSEAVGPERALQFQNVEQPKKFTSSDR